jgi:hypothetical protein
MLTICETLGGFLNLSLYVKILPNNFISAKIHPLKFLLKLAKKVSIRVRQQGSVYLPSRHIGRNFNMEDRQTVHTHTLWGGGSSKVNIS